MSEDGTLFSAVVGNLAFDVKTIATAWKLPPAVVLALALNELTDLRSYPGLE